MSWFGKRKALPGKKKPFDPPGWKAAARARKVRELNGAHDELVKMERGIPHLQERVAQNQFSAAAIAARNAGFSESVCSALEQAQKLCEPPTFNERVGPETTLKGQERTAKAKTFVAEAGAYALIELEKKVEQARKLRSELKDL